MARATFNYLNGQNKTYTNVSVRPFKGKYYVYPKGSPKGTKPIAVIAMNQLHAVKRTGQKGLNLVRD